MVNWCLLISDPAPPGQTTVILDMGLAGPATDDLTHNLRFQAAWGAVRKVGQVFAEMGRKAGQEAALP